ncbi:uncharacterized protein [Physcomitrium patens]|uniref:BAT2 N-terminal domain-containing protein n=1 Tax=Physcomitrium patens TaxID=3218 RepID=A0A7I4DK46_PHYPA|nr:filaggrin-like isoform X2 [Physcomitrium patens]|eukprot:XP_024374036.1 filaggrin-like isoform X2 [Physcomitrella patens]
MLPSDRSRGSSARRGLQVLGKIPTVPKPINLPSQRLENRGLDPNVEIVPRGSVGWGSAGRSPPTTSNAWGTIAQASSPPSGSGAWGPKVGNSGTGGGTTLGAPGIIPRPSSGGSGGRPLSAESVGQAQQSPDSFSENTDSSGACRARPSSASGVLGQAQPLVAQAQAQARPRSADITRPARNLSEFGDQSADSSPAGNPAWTGRRRLGEEPHQASRFQLTRTDFPTLGSEKNPDLRPQQSSTNAERGPPVEANGPHAEERRPPTPPGPREILPPRPRSAEYGHPERSGSDNWRREGPAFQGPSPHVEGNWHRDGPSARPLYGGQGPHPEGWRREGGPSGGTADDNWRRGGAPPVGQYGPPPGPGHYPHEGPGFMHGPRFGSGPGGFGRGAPGPGGYGHHGDMYGHSGPLLRPAGPMHPMRPNMFQGPIPYDGFYGPPGPGYQNMEDPERMMMGMGGGPGPYGGYGPHRGPPPEAFGRFGHGGMNQGPRHHREGNLRERGEVVGEGYHESQNYHKESGEGRGHKDGRAYGERFNGGSGDGQEGGDNRRGGLHRGAPSGGDVYGQTQRGASGGHRDWGAVASSDEPMDFSKPVFEEEPAASASPVDSGKQFPSSIKEEESAVEEVKRENVEAERSVVEEEVVKEEDKEVVVAVKSDPVAAASKPSVEVSRAPRAKVEGIEVAEGKDELERKTVNVLVVEKEFVTKIATKDRWERGSRRGENQSQVREAGHSDGNVGSVSLRSSPYGGGGGGKSSILGNAPRNAVADVAGGPASMHHWSQEKSGGVGRSSERSEAEVPKGGEMGRMLRRPESPRVQAGGVEDGVSDVGVVQTDTGHDGGAKDATKLKTKVASHDGEKEWRPKVPIAEVSPRHSAGVAALGPKAGVAGWGSAVEDTESKGAEPGSGTQAGPDNNVDAEVQQASMKEKVAQMASRLAKEEEERVREQKAKARAKLEELDRRCTAVLAVAAEKVMVSEVLKPSIEGCENREVTEEVVAAESAAVVHIGSGSTKRGGRNEHGKLERDRKVHGRKTGVVEGDRVKANGGAGVPPLASGSGGPLLSNPVSVGETHCEQVNPQRESRHKGRPEKQQVVGGIEEGERPVAVAGASPDISLTGGNGGWNMDSVALREVDPGNTGHVGTSSSDGPGSLRKSKSKSSRNSKNKQHPEAPAVMMLESIQFGDIVSGLHSTDFHISGSELQGDPGASGWHMDAGKDVSLSGDALTGDEGSAVSTNEDGPSKRTQRKSRGGWRQSRSDRGSQDQRTAEKSHGGDTMVWAPVRSPGAGGGAKGEGPQLSDQQEDSGSVSQQGRGKRAEMERYTPKPLMKYQESSEQTSVSLHAQTQGGHNQGSQGGVAVDAVAAESARVVGVAEGKQSWIGDGKGSQDAKARDSGSKGGRSHGSWRQRSSGSESAKDAPATIAGGLGQGDAEHHRQRSDQRSGGGVGLSRRNQFGSEHSTTSPQATAVGVPAAGVPLATGLGPAPALVSAQVSEREYPADKKLYQPPRHASGAGQRGQDYRGQDVRGQEHRGQDHRGHCPYAFDHKEQEQGTGGRSRHFNAASDRAVTGETTGLQQHQRNIGGQHPRSHNVEKDQALSQQVYVTPHAQQKPHPAAAAVESSRSVSSEREGQQQQGWRGQSQHSGSSGEQGYYNRGRLERDQAVRISSGPQRGQGHWQQSGGNEGFRSGPLRPHLPERDVGGSRDSSRAEVSQQQAGESQRGHGSEQAGQQQNKGGQQTAPVAIPSAKTEGGNWGGEGGSPPVVRGRDYNHGRRGRFGGRSGPRSTEVEHRRDLPAAKQRLVIDATGGAVPSQVGV